MNSKYVYGGLVIAIALGMAGCSGDTVPLETEGSSSGGASTDATATGTTGNSSTPPTTDGPTTDASTTDASTGAPTTGGTTIEVTTGGTTGEVSGSSTGSSTGDVSGSSTGGTTGEPLASCVDGVLNQDETDIDCGGLTCGGCIAGQICLDTPDCAEGVCFGGVCTIGACDDGVMNLDETDIDCGGSCPACGLDQACLENVDCAEGACVANVCTAVECLADVDCDGQDSACSDATCDLGTYTCVGAPVNDGGDCDDGDLCSVTSTCNAGACTAGMLVDCKALDSACAVGSCNPNDGKCVAAPANEGAVCDDNNNCTVASVCAAGKCGDPLKPGYVLNEDFSDNLAGWTLDANWAIGPAVAGCSNGDPATDHTPTADNGLAGVVIGGCAPTGPVDAAKFFCLTSPAVDTTKMSKVFVNYWRDLTSDYTPYMKNKIEVWNGNAWVIVFETFGAPEVNDVAWTKFSYDVTAQSNAALKTRWCYNIGSGGVFSVGSWSVDDVVIGETAVCAP